MRILDWLLKGIKARYLHNVFSLLYAINNPAKIALSFFARQGAKRANTRWYLTDEQRSIAEKGGASMWGYFEHGPLDNGKSVP